MPNVIESQEMKVMSDQTFAKNFGIFAFVELLKCRLDTEFLRTFFIHIKCAFCQVH